MGHKPDPVARYHDAIESLARQAEEDKVLDLATILETVSSAISLGLLPGLAATCLEFWKKRAGDLRQSAPESQAQTTGGPMANREPSGGSKQHSRANCVTGREFAL